MNPPVEGNRAVVKLSELPAVFSPRPVVVFTDVDDTLTYEGRLPVETFKALHLLMQAGIEVIPVTGASAGWCDCIIKTWPVNHIIGENGALTMEKNAKGIVSAFFSKSEDEVKADFSKLLKLGDELSKTFPEIQYTQDQQFRVGDIAFDIGQTVTVDESIAEAATAWLLDHGTQAKRSSIHINAWIGEYTKATGAMNWLKQHNISEQDCLFIGDSPNDESMFKQFSVSIGVANIQRFLSGMDHLPLYMTNAEGGYGFAELANVLLNS